METSIKKRSGKRITPRHRVPYGNSVVESWPEDCQRSLRYPALVCVLQGQADFHIADYVVHCPQGHFLFLSPGVPQPDATRPHLEGDYKAERYCEVLWFVEHAGTNCVTLSICCSQGDKHWPRNSMKFRMVSNTDVLDTFRFFTREVMERPQGFRKTATTSFATFLQLYLRALRDGHFHYYGHGDESQQLSHNRSTAGAAQQYINDNIDQRLTTASVARALFMSRTNFVRRFHQETGESFNGYLTAQRLKVAKRLLEEGSWPIGTIAQRVGLSSAQFRNLVKKDTGITPSQFRHNSREKVQT